MSEPTRFEFLFTRAYRVAALPFGITPRTTSVEVSSSGLHVRFGPWRLTTTLLNIADLSLTGPYRFITTAGPAHLSLADRGVTFATNGVEGLCLQFVEPVPGIDPTRRILHPGATLTVAEPARLMAAIRTHRDTGCP